MNKVILTGNLCRDIEVRQTQSGKEVVSNCIAVQRDFRESDGNYKSDFINFVAWGSQATYLGKYAHKGDRMEIVGRWANRQYTDNDGVERTVNECVVENLKVFSKQNESTKPTMKEVEEDEDFPF